MRSREGVAEKQPDENGDDHMHIHIGVVSSRL